MLHVNVQWSLDHWLLGITYDQTPPCDGCGQVHLRGFSIGLGPIRLNIVFAFE